MKKVTSGNLLLEVDNKKHTESLIKMKIFYSLKCKVYPHAKRNTSKGVISNKELSVATPE